jgi:hypothetical protein
MVLEVMGGRKTGGWNVGIEDPGGPGASPVISQAARRRHLHFCMDRQIRNNFLFSDQPSWQVFPSAETISVLRAERRRWRTLEFSPDGAPAAPVAASGGRWELRAKLHQTGLREDGAGITQKIAFTLVMELTWIAGSWRIVQFTF